MAVHESYTLPGLFYFIEALQLVGILPATPYFMSVARGIEDCFLSRLSMTKLTCGRDFFNSPIRLLFSFAEGNSIEPISSNGVRSSLIKCNIMYLKRGKGFFLKLKFF